MSFPSLTSVEPHNAFNINASECTPLAVRSSLLKPESDKADLFLLPVPARTTSQHLRIAKEHGLENPTYQSLATPPLTHKQVHADCSEEAMEVEPSPVFTHENDDPEDVYNEIMSLRINPSRMALQKTLGRWGNAMVYLAKAFKEDIVEYSGNDSFNSILLNEVGGFPLKHSQLKTKIDKYKQLLSKDLQFLVSLVLKKIFFV